MTRLQSVRLHWWLGRRLLRAPGQRWALAALALTSTLSALLILGLTAAPNVLDDQQASEAARTVTETGKRTGVTAYASIWDWRDEHSIYLLRIGVEAENVADAAHLPGVPRPPMLDEIWLSPQLAQDLARDPVLRRAFPQHVVGAIDESVLPTSQDRVAYIGVDPKALTQRGIRATQSIGTEPSESQTSSRMLVLLGGATLALFVVVPLAAVSIAAFGLLAQPRQRQVRLLEALGATPRRARVLVSADGIVAGLLGTAVAWLLFETLSRAVTHVPFTPARWTAGQPDIQVTGALLSLLAPLAAATWAAWRLKDRTTPDQVRPRRAAGRHPSIVPLPLLFAAVALVAVLATSGVRADSSPLASAAVAAAVSLSALSAPAAITWGQQAIGLALLRSTRLSATALVAGARLARVKPKGSRTASMLVPAFVLALAVAPLIAQAAPRDTATEELNRRAGRVVAFMSPVPDSGTQERIRNLPGVLAASAPNTGRQLRYLFACPDFKRLLALETYSIGALATPMELSPEVSAGFPYLGDWTFLATDTTNSPPVQQRTSADPSAPLIVMLEDPDSYWSVAAMARGLDPGLDTEANIGGLIGGAQQTYRTMQEWLKAGLALLLLAAGVLMALGAFTDVRERARIRRALTALGASAQDTSRTVRSELLVRSAVILATATIVGSAVAAAARGWGNTQSIGASWVAGCFGLLLIALALGTFIPLLAIRGRSPNHAAEDAYVHG